MYKQFQYFSSINTSERNYKKIGIDKIKPSYKIFETIYYRNKEHNWKPFHKNIKYFSYISPLNSTLSTLNNHINNKSSYYKNEENNWKPFNKNIKYFSYISPLISTESNINYYLHKKYKNNNK